MRIVFVLGSLQNQRCIKRIRSFIEKGADVSVYAFNRSDEMFNSEVGFPIHVIGSFHNELPYLKRMPILLRSLKGVPLSESDLCYLFGLDVALAFSLTHYGARYVYEESDLVHTYLGGAFLRRSFELLDKLIIRRSFRTVFTSEGFSLYHFGNDRPKNVRILPNKLSKEVYGFPCVPKRNHGNLRIGFVGKIRFESVLSFADFFCSSFPQHEFHFYGAFCSERDKEMFSILSALPNCFFHGAYKNPGDLADIYADIDLVLATYDVRFENVRYAEPNKLYEAIFFETPIIVSSGTFLSERVEKLNIGFSLDASDRSQVVSFVEGLSETSLAAKLTNIRLVPKSDAVDDLDAFVEDVLQYD